MSIPQTLAALAAVSTLALAGAPAALAQNATPSFAVQTAADSYIRGGYSAYERGHFRKSAVFSVHATAKGNKKSRRSIAYANLCAALGQQARLDAALDACNSAVDLAPANWRALNNRGVVHYLSGDLAAASADFAAAAAAPKAGKLAQDNASLARSAKLAVAE